MESERRNPCAVVGESGDSGLYFSLFSWKFFAGLPFAEDFSKKTAVSKRAATSLGPPYPKNATDRHLLNIER